MFPTFYVSKVAATLLPATQQAKLTASDGDTSDTFGYSVSIDSNTVIVGALFEDGSGTNRGAAYVYTRSGTTWTEQQKLVSSDTGDSDFFGLSVAIDGNTVIVGAPYESTGGTQSGAAYVFTRSGSTWTEQQKLVASDASSFSEFGASVAISGETVIIGAYQDNGAGSARGAAYVFTRSGSTWSQQQKLEPSDPEDSAYFGWSVDVQNDSAIVGARLKGDGGTGRGAAYVFTRSGSTWTQQQKLTASDTADYDEFGISVSIDQDTAIVGADRRLGSGVDGGAAYVYTRTGGTWTQQQKLVPSDLANGDAFGCTVSVQNNIAIVGAYLQDESAAAAGATYIFTRSGSTWTEFQKIFSGDIESNDAFGFSVDLDGNSILVGAPYEDGAGTDKGAAYVFVTG